MKALNRIVAFALSLLLCLTGIPTPSLATVVDAVTSPDDSPALLEYRVNAPVDAPADEGWQAYDPSPTKDETGSPDAGDQPLSRVEIRFADGQTLGVTYAVRDASGTWSDPWLEDGQVAEVEDGITGIAIRLCEEHAQDYDVAYRDPSTTAAESMREGDETEGDPADQAEPTWAKNGEELVTELPATLCDIEIRLCAKQGDTPEEEAPAQGEETEPSPSNATDDPSAQSDNGSSSDVLPTATSSTHAETPTVAKGTADTTTSDAKPAADTPTTTIAPKSAQRATAQPTLTTRVMSAPTAHNPNAVAAAIAASEPALTAIPAQAPTPTASASTSLARGLGTPVLAAASVTWKRLYGTNRYATMSQIVSEGYGTSDWAVIATGDNFPDALTASSLAGIKNCPIILTSGNTLSTEARLQLTRLHVRHAFVMGGPNAISSSMESEFAAMGIEIARVFGNTRQDTSLSALNYLRSSGSTSDTLVIAAGSNYPDALSIGPWAYRTSSPIILTDSNGTLSASAVSAVQSDPRIKNVVIVGGSAVVSDDVKTQLGPTYTYTRLGGANRYATSRAIVEWEIKHGFDWASPTIASGANYPDALAGAPLCGQHASPLLLANKGNDTTLALLYANKGNVEDGYILGGAAAVSFSNPITAYELSNLQLNGVDISGHNVPIDTAALDADFVIIKVTEGYDGTVWNPTYKELANDAVASGKLIGFYHYANGLDATKEAEQFYNAIKDYKGKAIACLDWEGQGNDTFDTGIDALWCGEFLNRLQQLYGGTPFLYTSKNNTKDQSWSTVAAKYPLWGAQYADYNPVNAYDSNPWQSDDPWGPWGSRPTIFQYTSQGYLAQNGGTRSTLDLDLFYGRRADWIAYQG